MYKPAGSAIRTFYDRAKPLLQNPVLSFDEVMRHEIARAFADVVGKENYTCYACAIMPDHIHILIRKHKHLAEQMMERFRDASRERLRQADLVSPDHPIWSGGGGWKVFLDHPDEIRRTITYIEKNPAGIGLPSQHWSFVTKYDGWPLHKRVANDN